MHSVEVLEILILTGVTAWVMFSSDVGAAGEKKTGGPWQGPVHRPGFH